MGVNTTKTECGFGEVVGYNTSAYMKELSDRISTLSEKNHLSNHDLVILQTALNTLHDQLVNQGIFCFNFEGA